jgi:two-component system CAI-1 autoinducer sensor kinase/phosphatase CqsS
MEHGTSFMDSIKQIYNDAEPNISAIGWGGFVCFPLFYYVWTYLIPQPYENLSLRVTIAVLMLSMVKRHAFPRLFQRYLPYYFTFISTLCLPYFFFYMLVMNAWSNEWGMSCMLAIMIHILIVQRIAVVFWQVVTSVIMAYMTVFWVIGYEPFNVVDWPKALLFIFAYILGCIFVRRSQSSQASKVSIAKSFGAGIAHEMRNPMSTVKTSVDVLRSLTPVIKENEYSVTIKKKDVEQIHAILDSTDNVLYSANEAIDLLLTSIDKSRINSTSYKRCCASSVIRDSLLSFPYKQSGDQHRVNLEIRYDFEYFGSDTLLKYTLYNLLKNAFYYNYSDNFAIHIELDRIGMYNVVRVRDNGIGIDEEMLEQIFDDFFSSGKHDGFGLGLPFCRKVMESFGGRISCKSVVNRWTEFTLYFPLYNSKKVKVNKSEVIKSKHVLYIGEKDVISGNLRMWAYAQGFNVSRMHLHRARYAKTTEFDLVIVDIEKAYFQLTDFMAFESNQHFAKSKICYLHDEDSKALHQMPITINAKLISIQQWQVEGKMLFDDLIFNNHDSVRPQYQHNISHSKHRVLVVDDNHSLRAITSILLKKEGYIVDQAQQGQEALELIRDNSYDVVLLDVEMPVLNGLELTALIRGSNEHYRNITILGYTGDNSPLTIAALKQAGMNDYMVKPANKKELLAKLGRWCLG